jgi:hypothetical protein
MELPVKDPSLASILFFLIIDGIYLYNALCLPRFCPLLLCASDRRRVRCLGFYYASWSLMGCFTGINGASGNKRVTVQTTGRNSCFLMSFASVLTRLLRDKGNGSILCIYLPCHKCSVFADRHAMDWLLLLTIYRGLIQQGPIPL